MCKQTGSNTPPHHDLIPSTCKSNYQNVPSTMLAVPFMEPKSPPNDPQITTINHNNHNYIHYIQSNEKEDDGDTNFSCLSSLKEAKAIGGIALPMILTGILIYSRSIISMLFLGRLGELALAGGSLALGFANITGYSVLSGLALGMEPICGQAFGAQKHSLLGSTLIRTIVFLVISSIPISILWVNMDKIFLLCGQDQSIATQAQVYLLYSIPDLLAQSLLHPLRIFLRTQAITLPLTVTSALAIVLHLPLNCFLVLYLQLGIKGVALASVATNFLMLLFLIIYIVFFNHTLNLGWSTLLGRRLFFKEEIHQLVVKLAIPSCISVCLEWWWYEIMIILCGLLPNPKATVASMGILIQTTALIYIFPSSLSVSLSTRVGNELGAGRPKRAKRAAVTGLLFSFILGFTALSFTLMVANKWAAVFTHDSDIIHLTTLVLPIIGLCELGNCPQTTGCGVLRGTARPKVGANINLCCFYLVGMPVAVWLGFFAGYGFRGLWLGMLAAQASCVVAMMVVLNWTDWEFQAQRAKRLTHDKYLDGEHDQRVPLLV